jgi:hypothetical protein
MIKENNRKQIVIIVFCIIFLSGLLMVLNATSLGDFFSRDYDANGWSINGIKSDAKAISFMIVGTLLSFITGFGLMLLVIKKVFYV